MLNNLTFVTPLQIESNDRVRNAITIFSYLSKNFPESKIIVKEIDTDSKFSSLVLPQVEKLVGTNHNIQHIFEKSDKLFNKSKVINDMVLMAETDIVFNYDVDVMMPVDTYYQAYQMLVEGGFDVVYPYGCGVYQYNVLNFDLNRFIKSNFELETLIPQSQRLPSVQGWCQMFKKQIYCDCFGFNENFIFVGYEDTEFLHRLNVFEYNVGRVNNDIFHLEHVRVHNKNYSDKEFYEKNIVLWEWMRKQDKETIQRYYQSQDYIKKFK